MLSRLPRAAPPVERRAAGCAATLRPCSSRHMPIAAAKLHNTVIAWAAASSTSSTEEGQQERQPQPSSLDAGQQQEEASAAPMQEPEPLSFDQLGVDRIFLPGLARMKVHRPVEIQISAIPAILSKDNVAMQSYTGSGKTLAYLLPTMTLAIQRAEALYKAGCQDLPVQLLVVAPSQELAMQIVRVAQGLLPEEHRRTVQQCIGGANPKYQQEALVMNKPIVVVGTPGRLSEFVRTGLLRLHRCPLLVLDEADQLLAPNFAEDLNHLHQHCGKRLGPQQREGGASNVGKREAEAAAVAAAAGVPSQRQTVLVSATLSQSVLKRSAEWCPSPRYVTQGSAPAPSMPSNAGPAPSAAVAPPTWGWGVRGWDGPANDLGPRTSGSAGGVEGEAGLVPTLPPHLDHYYVVVDPRHKADALRRCIYAMGVERALVFMNYQQRLKDTMFRLAAKRMKVAALHGEMNKLARTTLLSDFRRGRTRALIVSDVVSRGLDVEGVTAVFNAELPSSASHYAHRAGRTGRMGASGMVVSLVSRSEVFVVEKLSRKLGITIQEAHPSHGELVLGPAPFTQRWDDDLEEEEAQQGGKGEGGKRDGAKGPEVKARGAAPSGKGERRVEGSAASSSSSAPSRGRTGRAGSEEVDLVSEEGEKVATGQGRGRGFAGQAGVRGSSTTPTTDQGHGTRRGDQDGASDDDDEEVDIDVAKLRRDVRRGRALRGLDRKGAEAPGEGVAADLQRELDEVRAERGEQGSRQQRRGGRTRRGGAATTAT